MAVLVLAYLIQEVRDIIKRHQRPRGSTYTSAYVSIRQHSCTEGVYEALSYCTERVYAALSLWTWLQRGV